MAFYVAFYVAFLCYCVHKPGCLCRLLVGFTFFYQAVNTFISGVKFQDGRLW